MILSSCFFIYTLLLTQSIDSKWIHPSWKKMIPVRGYIQLNNRVFNLNEPVQVPQTIAQSPALEDSPSTTYTSTTTTAIAITTSAPTTTTTTPAPTTPSTTTTTTTTTPAPTTPTTTTTTTTTTPAPTTPSTTTTTSTVAPRVVPTAPSKTHSVKSPSKSSAPKANPSKTSNFSTKQLVQSPYRYASPAKTARVISQTNY